ncbi:hypothetical protein HS125_12100 [bacterium]|nr:hypothetical protein [bacterium]
MLLRQALETRQVGGNAENIYGQKAANGVIQHFFRAFRGDIERRLVDVHEDGFAAGHNDGIGGRDKTEGRGDDALAFLQAGGQQRHVQAGGSVAHGDGVGNADIAGEGGLKPRAGRTQRQVGRGEHVPDRLALGVGQVGAREMNANVGDSHRF